MGLRKVSKAITKAKRALHAIKLMGTYFTKGELYKLLTSNFYSMLYYNSKIWLIPTLNQCLEPQMLSASVYALKMCTQSDTNGISF